LQRKRTGKRRKGFEEEAAGEETRVETAAAKASVRAALGVEEGTGEAASGAVKVSAMVVGGRAVEMEAAADCEAEERAAEMASETAVEERVAATATRRIRHMRPYNDRAKRASCLAGRCPHNSRLSIGQSPCEQLRNRNSTAHRTD